MHKMWRQKSHVFWSGQGTVGNSVMSWSCGCCWPCLCLAYALWWLSQLCHDLGITVCIPGALFSDPETWFSQQTGEDRRRNDWHEACLLFLDFSVLAGSRARYVDVLNPGGTKSSGALPAPSDLFAPLAPMPIPANVFVPNSGVWLSMVVGYLCHFWVSVLCSLYQTLSMFNLINSNLV